MAIMNSSKYPQRSSFITCATGGASFNHTSFFNPADANTSFSSLPSAGSSFSTPIIEGPLATFAEQPQHQPLRPAPRKRGRKRTKITDPNHIPRPMNCFIQFRRQWVLEHRDTELAKGNKSLSKLAGEAWNQLSKEERDHFNQLAKDAKKKHEEEFPEYKYEPKRRAPRVTQTHRFKRSFSHEQDPDWIPSILRGSDSSASSERSSHPPSDMYLTTDDSDVDSLNTPYYSRGSSVDLSYSPDGSSPEHHGGDHPYPSFTSFPGMANAVIPPKDDRTPTQADFAYQIHAQMLPEQPMPQVPHPSHPTTYPNYGAASNAQDLATIPQYDPSTIPHTPQPFPYYHALPLQQVAHTLPSDHDSISPAHPHPPSQGPESMHYYDDFVYPSTQISNVASTSSSTGASSDTSNPIQWEQTNNNDSLYASALDNTTPQFATDAPFSDFLGLSSDLPITPLTRMFFEIENRVGNSSSISFSSSQEVGDLQDSFVSSLDAPRRWIDVQESSDGSGWHGSN